MTPHIDQKDKPVTLGVIFGGGGAFVIVLASLWMLFGDLAPALYGTLELAKGAVFLSGPIMIGVAIWEEWR